MRPSPQECRPAVLTDLYHRLQLIVTERGAFAEIEIGRGRRYRPDCYLEAVRCGREDSAHPRVPRGYYDEA